MYNVLYECMYCSITSNFAVFSLKTSYKLEHNKQTKKLTSKNYKKGVYKNRKQ